MRNIGFGCGAATLDEHTNRTMRALRAPKPGKIFGINIDWHYLISREETEFNGSC